MARFRGPWFCNRTDLRRARQWVAGARLGIGDATQKSGLETYRWELGEHACLTQWIADSAAGTFDATWNVI